MSAQLPAFFHRPKLAAAIATQALSNSPASSGGLFLAAPRRTGKSTFIRQDLIPDLETRGVETIYVDLWADKSANPAVLIANAVRAKLQAKESALTEWAQAAGIKTVRLGLFGSGLQFDLSALNLPKEATIADALQALSLATGRRIVFVVDEAQHAATTTEGMNSLFALKAARDRLNTESGLHGFQLIATGSNRDRLANLVTSKDQAFYLARITELPRLGPDFVQWEIEKSGIRFNPASANEAFTAVGQRPEPFISAIMDVQTEIAAGTTHDPDGLLIQRARQSAQDFRDRFFEAIDSLAPLQAAVLKEIAAESKRSRKVGPFSADMQNRIRARIENDYGPDANVHVDSSATQNALDYLRQEQYLWKPQRGSYHVEDEQMIEWLTTEDDAPETAERHDTPRG